MASGTYSRLGFGKLIIEIRHVIDNTDDAILLRISKVEKLMNHFVNSHSWLHLYGF